MSNANPRPEVSMPDLKSRVNDDVAFVMFQFVKACDAHLPVIKAARVSPALLQHYLSMPWLADRYQFMDSS